MSEFSPVFIVMANSVAGIVVSEGRKGGEDRGSPQVGVGPLLW